jgi:dTDP-glucose 4,6-dehydratase
MSASSKKVLLTGAGGFAGSHCLEHLLVNTDWDVVCTDSFKHKGKTDRIAEVLAARPEQAHRVTVVTHDLTAPFSTQIREKIGRCDYILAYASESHVNRSITDPVPFVMNNVAVILNTLEYARMARPEAFLMVSTDEVYGPILDNIPFKEWDRIIPSNPYSGSKAAQEAIAISYWRTYNVPVVIVNSMNVIGERQDPEKYVPLVINKCLKGEELTIHGSPDNIGSRHYMHARNLADAILFILRKQSPAPYHQYIPAYVVRSEDRPDRYNIAPPDRVDNLTLAKMIAGYIGVDIPYKFEDFPDQRPGHDAHYGLDSTKLFDLGWKQPVDFEASLKKTVEWYLKNPQWLRE